MNIKKCTQESYNYWLALRIELWPSTSISKHKEEMDSFLAEPNRYLQFIYFSDKGLPVGLVEASIRHDYVNGVNESPVVFLEGVYVDSNFRRKGIARNLLDAVAKWAKQKNIFSIASDALISNQASHDLHKALGFEETERVVFYKRVISE